MRLLSSYRILKFILHTSHFKLARQCNLLRSLCPLQNRYVDLHPSSGLQVARFPVKIVRRYDDESERCRVL